MKRSTDAILTTHVGSLPRPQPLQDLLQARRSGSAGDRDAFDSAVGSAVADIVRRQIAAGITVVNDGEQGKPSYTGYIRDRLDGFSPPEPVPVRVGREPEQFPEFFARPTFSLARETTVSMCAAPLAWRDFSAVEKDIGNLTRAAAIPEVQDVFMTAASPGVIATSSPNRYYPSEEAYLYAAADVMKREYAAIVEAGLTLQLDCPDLAMSRDRTFAHLSDAEFLAVVALHVEALNYAVADLDPQRMRIHVCWGRPERPHNTDVPLSEIVQLLMRARPAGISFTAANGRHEHEWKVWQDVSLPAEKVLIPGVIDSTSNIVEHPEAVADRIVRFAGIVGRENVIAGVDCGFGTIPTGGDVDPRVMWAKLEALGEGARLASRRLWP
jgi:5-methyltetrahydropteroyltriglutamate--homocysteine methyltransferase